MMEYGRRREMLNIKHKRLYTWQRWFNDVCRLSIWENLLDTENKIKLYLFKKNTSKVHLDVFESIEYIGTYIQTLCCASSRAGHVTPPSATHPAAWQTSWSPEWGCIIKTHKQGHTVKTFHTSITQYKECSDAMTFLTSCLVQLKLESCVIDRKFSGKLITLSLMQKLDM